MLSEWESGQEFIAEPEKCIAQAWHTFEDLPSPLFLPWNQLLNSEFIKEIKRILI